jgi:hypothetical protein
VFESPDSMGIVVSYHLIFCYQTVFAAGSVSDNYAIKGIPCPCLCHGGKDNFFKGQTHDLSISFLEENAHAEMELTQLGGADEAKRFNEAHLAAVRCW